MLEVTEQRPMNNKYVNSCISKLSLVTLAGILKLYSKFCTLNETCLIPSAQNCKLHYVIPGVRRV